MDIPPTEYRKFKRLANEMFLSVDHSSETAAEDLKRKHIFELKHGNKYKGFPIAAEADVIPVLAR